MLAKPRDVRCSFNDIWSLELASSFSLNELCLVEVINLTGTWNSSVSTWLLYLGRFMLES
jgi:hypothetical protein